MIAFVISTNRNRDIELATVRTPRALRTAARHGRDRPLASHPGLVHTSQMTLAAAWVRQVSTLRQLVVIADSRGTGGEVWDWCPKVIPLPRPATIGAVAGDLALGYAYLIQAVSATALDEGNRSGRVDIGNFATQVDRLLKPARSPLHLTDLPHDGD